MRLTVGVMGSASEAVDPLTPAEFEAHHLSVQSDNDGQQSDRSKSLSPEGNAERRWYHGSLLRLTRLTSGSSITQDVAIARAFSHRPSLVSVEDDGTVKHNGTTPGYLYAVAEAVLPRDVVEHPQPVNARHWEWLTQRELKIELIEPTRATNDELLTEAEITRLRLKQETRGETMFRE